MPRTQIVHLSPNGVYKATQGKLDAEWPNLVSTKVDGQQQSFQLVQNPSFLVEERPFLLGLKPVRFDTWEDFIQSDPPKPSLRTNTRMIITEMNNPYPVACEPPPTLEDRHYHGEALYEEMDQSAQNHASQDELGTSARRMVFLLLGSATFLLAVVLGFIVAAERFG